MLVQDDVLLTQFQVLSVAPFTVRPPPLAVASVAPPELNVIAPGVAWLTDRVICVKLSTVRMVGVAPNAPVPLVTDTVIPGINPVVLVPPVSVTIAVPVDSVACKPVTVATLANSRFLSSTVTVLELIVLNVPLTIKLPPTVTSLAMVIAPVFVIVNASVNVLAVAPELPTGAVLNIMLPDPPVPVPLPASIIVLAPTMLVPTATPDLNVAIPPAPLVLALPAWNVAAPPAPLVAPPAPADIVNVLPALAAPVAPGCIVNALDVCVVIVVAVALAPTVIVLLLTLNA